MTFLRLTITLLIFLNLSNAFASSSSPAPLVETEWLASQISNVVVLDVRTSKKSFVSKPAFNKNKNTGKLSLSRVGGHIPDARLVLYKNVRGDRLIDGKTVKHMVVSSEQFQTLMQQAGVDQDSHVVIATNAESGFDLTMASRMYWQVKYFGHDKVSILNGGTAQWLIDGLDIETSLINHPPGNWKASSERKNLFASSDDVHTASNNDATQLVDVRSLGQYLGTTKSGKAKAKGHIPTAKIFPIDLISNGSAPVKFSASSELKQLSKALSINDQQDIITYCNSGHMASGGWFVFHEILGNKNVKLYDGSMHQWTLEDRPVISMKIE
ncbi:MAG: sulfurtransferase [Gammaproteobacteria bacterium]